MSEGRTSSYYLMYSNENVCDDRSLKNVKNQYGKHLKHKH
jgi:hypothetical protein